MRSIWLLVLLAAVVSAQARPNFSGAWKQDNSKSSQPASTIQYINKIHHHDPELVVTVVSGSNRAESSWSTTYSTDGKQTISVDREGDELTTTVKWDGATLVFNTVEKDKKGVKTIRETWTLSDDGKTLTKARHTASPRGESDQTFVLDKQ